MALVWHLSLVLLTWRLLHPGCRLLRNVRNKFASSNGAIFGNSAWVPVDYINLEALRLENDLLGDYFEMD